MLHLIFEKIKMIFDITKHNTTTNISRPALGLLCALN